MRRGLYAQAARLEQEVIASPSILAALSVVNTYEGLLSLWRDDLWIGEAGRIAIELHAEGFPEKAQKMMQQISDAFSQGDAETVLAGYVRFLQEERRARGRAA